MNSRRFFFVAILTGLVIAANNSPSPAADKAAESVEKKIAQLIDQLGHTSFAMRERAQRELAKIGGEAFDALAIAQEDADVERAMRARFLMRSIRIEWTSKDDPSWVRKIMKDYNSADEAERVEALDSLERAGLGGLPAICRIVHFDKSERVAKYAALKIAALEPKSQAVRATRDKIVTANISPRVKRPAADWARMFVDSHGDFDAAATAWTKRIAAEQKVLVQDPTQTSSQLVALLLSELLDRLIDRQRWDELKTISGQFTKITDGNWRLLYALAWAEKLQGRDKAAQAAALKVFKINPKDALAHWRAARELMDQGMIDWSEREFRHVIDSTSAFSRAGLNSQLQLGSMLHDQLRDEDAAKALQAAIDALKAEVKNRGLGRIDAVKNIIDDISARMHFYHSVHHLERGNQAKQIEHLKQAVLADPADADVLIALYRLPKGDAELHKETLAHIKKAAAAFRKDIRQRPDSAFPYNQCAWLVGNTTADVNQDDADEAIRFSQKSLELQPDTGGYLDTLAHCYFTKKDYAAAVKYQRLAVKYDPHSKLIAKKLGVFEKALERAND
jgi:tetratricopeptide (TPR) repeat protein